jgi:hypothetical protein
MGVGRADVRAGAEARHLKRNRPRWLPLVAALALAGCVTPGGAPQGGSAGSASNVAAAAAPAAAGGLARALESVGIKMTVNPAGNVDAANAFSRAASLGTLPPGTGPLTTRDPMGLQNLMGRNLTGDTLIGELIAMRNHMRKQRSAKAVMQFMGRVDQANVTTLRSTNFREELVKTGINLALELAKQQALSISFQALEQHLATLTDGDGAAALRLESLQMPPAKDMSQAQQQRAVTMAAMIVAARVTNKVLKKAQRDFGGIESGYTDLLARREKAAALLYQTVLRGPAGQAELAASLRPSDLAFLESGGLAKLSLADFSKDLGAQNLALAYMQKVDPAAFAEYSAQREKMLPAAKGYVRAVSGGVAFAGMLTIFVQEMATLIQNKDVAEILTLLPLAYEFAVEIPGLVPVAFDAIGEGVKLPFKPSKRFRMLDAEGGAVEFGSAKEVFAELGKRSDADSSLRKAMFQTDLPGLVQRLYQCSPAESGRLLDAALPVAEREAFASSYFGTEMPRFSFASLFELPANERPGKQRDMGEELMRADYRARVDRQDRMPFATVQKKVADEGGFRRWGDEQLLRLIFVNRESSAQYATLELGGIKVRPVATAQSVFAYESLVDACKPLVEASAAPAAALPRLPTSRTAPAVPKPAIPKPVIPKPAVPGLPTGR